MDAHQKTIDQIRELLLTENSLKFLSALDEAGLRTLYGELHAYVQRSEANQKPVYQVMAAVTKMLPNFVVAKLAHDFLTPYIIAQVSLYLSAKDAANTARSLKVDYLAEATLYLDAAQIAPISDSLGINGVLPIVKEMIRKGMYLRLAELSEAISEALLLDLFHNLDDIDALAIIVDHLDPGGRTPTLSAKLREPRKSEVGDRLRRMNSDNAQFF